MPVSEGKAIEPVGVTIGFNRPGDDFGDVIWRLSVVVKYSPTKFISNGWRRNYES